MNLESRKGNPDILLIEPAKVEFTNVEPNVKYIQRVRISNLSNTVRRVRCEPPAAANTEFRVKCENQLAVAPGLAVYIDVEFLCTTPKDYVDKLSIATDCFRSDVSLVATVPCAVMSVDRELVDFGPIATKVPHHQDLIVRNTGERPGKFVIKYDEDSFISFVCDPIVEVPPNGQFRVKMEARADAAVTLNEQADFEWEGISKLAPVKSTVEIHGTLINQQVHIMCNDAPVAAGGSLDFGLIYHGRQCTRRVGLLNDGPCPLPYNAQIVAEAAPSSEDAPGIAATLSSPSEARDCEDQAMVLCPTGAGVIPAFSQVDLELTFAPPLHIQTKGFICNQRPQDHAEPFKFVFKVETEHVEHKVHLTGTGMLPAIKISPDSIYFGECTVHDRRDMVLSLRNTQTKLPLDFSVPIVPNIRVEPGSGVLEPLQSIDLIVSFQPKTLGSHMTSLNVLYCGMKYSQSIETFGKAPIIGEKEQQVRGLEKTDKDFVPTLKYVSQDEMTLNITMKKNFQSLTRIMKSSLFGDRDAGNALDSLMIDLPEPTPYSLSPSAMQEHVKNRQKYNNVIKASRIKRKKKLDGTDVTAPVDIFFEKDVDRGLTPGCGLRSPRLTVDSIPLEKLWLQRSKDEDSESRGVVGLRFAHDENRLLKKKFKAAPTTQAEVRDCTATLETWQLKLISTGPKILDFGNVYAKSTMTKSFSVYNDLPQSILVAMQYDCEELARSSPISQVIPSAEPGGFDVTVSSPVPQSFQRHVVYTINGVHAYKFLVKTEFTMVKLLLSRTEVAFRFGEDNLERILKESIILKNPGNAPARFSWQGANSTFSVAPSDGIVKANQSVTCELSFTPPPSGALMEGFLTLKTEDGYDQGLRCFGQAPESECAFGIKRLDFGALAVGLCAEKTLTVINMGRNNAVFHVETGLPSGVTVTPQRGRIVSEGRIDLTVSVILDEPVQLESLISLSIRGGKGIRLPLLASAVVPKIVFVEPEFDFGELTLGAVSTLPMTLRNSSAVEGTVYVNLHGYPSFTLALSDDREGTENNEETHLILPITLSEYHAMVPTQEDTRATNRQKLKNVKEEDEDEAENMQIFKIVVQPNSQLPLQLTYQPREVGKHYFEFPIISAGASTTSHEIPGLRRVVHAEALKPRMLFTTTCLDFKTKVVSSRVQAVAAVLELGLHNVDENPVEWIFDTEPLEKFMGIFQLDPSNGILPPNGDSLVRCAFLPTEPLQYSVQLPVFISPPFKKGEGNKESETTIIPVDDTLPPYLYLRIKGAGTVPKLAFDCREVRLPVVPLGIVARTTFYIFNQGYENLEVKCRPPTDNVRIPLTIDFPEGQQLGITKSKLPVEITFQSNKPISFCATIDFMDDGDGVYSIQVCGITDNCILTTYQFLHSEASDYELVTGKTVSQAIQLKLKQDDRDKMKSQVVSNASPSVSTPDTPKYDYLLRWMNGNVLKATLENFPHDLIQQNGRHVYEMIEFLSGKSVPKNKVDEKQSKSTGGKSEGKVAGREMARITQLIAQYETMLNFLKQHGALLSCTRPEHFLSLEHYVRYIQSQASGLTRRQIEKSYKSHEAWLNVILQTIKIFLLNRVTPKAFKTLPGMSMNMDEALTAPVGAEPEDEFEDAMKQKDCKEVQEAVDVKGLGDSNVYSISESILLRWINFHFWRGNKGRYEPRTILNFSDELQDSIVLATILQSHVPHCEAISMMKYPCTSLQYKTENARKICAALQEIGLQYPITAADIENPVERDMLLFIMFLYQHLPHFVPKTTIIFPSMLGANLVKHIELTNPSRAKPITYYLKLQGSSDFVVKDEVVCIEPRSVASVPIEYQSRFSRPVEGKVVFTSRREGNVHGAAMVFKLKSRCTGKKPKKTVNIAAVLYELGTVEVEVENPFPKDTLLELSMSQLQICDADGNRVKSQLKDPIDPFHLSSTKIRIKANGTSTMTISFLPFEVAHFSAQLGFYDSNVGEFIYELFGSASAPAPLDSYKIQVKAEEVGIKELILPHRNIQLDRARQWLEQKDSSGRNRLKSVPDQINYSLKLSSNFYVAPKSVTVVAAQAKETKKVESPKKVNVDETPGKITLEFRPFEPGVYPCSLILSSDIDFRIYTVEGTGTAPNTRCSLTFSTHARNTVLQDIPIINPSDKDWTIRATFLPDIEEFDGPREFTAKSRQHSGQATTSLFPLTFQPSWVADVNTLLSLYNQGTNETFEYELHGIADEPLATNHIIVKCEAREKTQYTFSVKNFSSKDGIFEVESDIMHISGPSHVVVPGKTTADYELTFQPIQAGDVTGCVMFKEQTTGHFTWYTCQVVTSPPKPQQSITLTCVVREAVAVDIQLINPLDDVVSFEVILNGEGLLGQPSFVLAPKEKATYELVYSPLLTARRKGTAVFINDRVGEFWYDLELIAEPCPPVEVPQLQCEVGRSVQTKITIDNPTGQELLLKHRSSNKINFKVVQPKIQLLPLESTSVTIEYSPASLGMVEEAQIVMENPHVGQWTYKMSGFGLPPLEAKEVTVVAQVNRPVSSSITFKNPFLESMQATVQLETSSDKSVFQLLNKKAKLVVGPLATCQIPFSFCPISMTQHTGDIIITCAKPHLSWTYHVQGVAEAPADATLHSFVTRARDTLDTFYVLKLVGLDLGKNERHTDALTLELDVPRQYQSLVNKCFSIELADPNAAPGFNHDKQKINLQVRFYPLRPFVAMCHLVVAKASGGRWRFELKLEATEPDVDDVITIESPLNKPASVAFRLCNHTNVYSEFDAFFDAESAYEFSVTPTSGVLEPAGKSGTAFIVSYRPTEYGKTVNGKLIIQTEDVFWSYLVKGTHPKYSAPIVDKAKVNTRLSKDLQIQLSQSRSQAKRKNFIRKNIAMTLHPSGRDLATIPSGDTSPLPSGR